MIGVQWTKIPMGILYFHFSFASFQFSFFIADVAALSNDK